MSKGIRSYPRCGGSVNNFVVFYVGKRSEKMMELDPCGLQKCSSCHIAMVPYGVNNIDYDLIFLIWYKNAEDRARVCTSMGE